MTETFADGFTVVRKLLTVEEIYGLRAAIEARIDRVARALLSPYDWSCPELSLEERFKRAASLNREYASALMEIVTLDVPHDPRFVALQSHPALSEIIDAVAAPEVPIGYAIALRGSLPSRARPRSGWQQNAMDEQSRCASDRLACWIPLSTVDKRAAAVEVLPGDWHAPLSFVRRGGAWKFQRKHCRPHVQHVYPWTRATCCCWTALFHIGV